MTTRRTREWCGAIHALMYLRYNAEPAEVLEMAWDTADLHAEYLAKKKAIWEMCPLSFFVQLDPERRAHFVENLRRRYEYEVMSRYELADAER